MTEMKTRLVIFDFDGTLCDTRRCIVTTMQQTQKACRLPVASEDVCASTIGLPLKNCFMHIYPDLSDAEATKCADTYRVIFEANKERLQPTLFPNVRETLKWLKDNGIVISIASSRSSKSIRDFLSGLGIIGDIAYILGAEDVTKPKPDAEPVLKTLGALHYSADEALVVGDMPFDILMGSNAGTRTCGVTYGNASRRQLEDSGANFVIDDMWELTEILESL